jgi:hypothetical protein
MKKGRPAMESKTPTNARQWEREPAAIPVSLVLSAEKFKSDPAATTIDISLSGVGVRTKLFLAPGEWVGIVPKGQFPQAIPARVAWAREDESNNLTIAGLTFIHTLET